LEWCSTQTHQGNEPAVWAVRTLSFVQSSRRERTRLGFHGREGRQQGRANAESALSFPICQIAKVTDFDKAARQYLQQKAAHKCEGRKCHYFLLVAVGRIAPAKGDLAVVKTEKPAVGDRDSMGIVSQIPNDMLRSGKRLLGVDHPLFLFERPSKTIESCAFGEIVDTLVRPHG
jgi:hypothetical protein